MFIFFFREMDHHQSLVSTIQILKVFRSKLISIYLTVISKRLLLTIVWKTFHWTLKFYLLKIQMMNQFLANWTHFVFIMCGNLLLTVNCSSFCPKFCHTDAFLFHNYYATPRTAINLFNCKPSRSKTWYGSFSSYCCMFWYENVFLERFSIVILIKSFLAYLTTRQRRRWRSIQNPSYFTKTLHSIIFSVQ